MGKTRVTLDTVVTAFQEGATAEEIVYQYPALDMVRIQDTEIAEADDPRVLEWTAQTNRVLLTHDISTITRYVYERIEAGLPMPGVLEVGSSVSIRSAIEDILLLAECSFEGEWEGTILYLPLQ